MYTAAGTSTSFFGSNVRIGSREVLPSRFLNGSLVLQIATNAPSLFGCFETEGSTRLK
jgi:hypothetical protein